MLLLRGDWSCLLWQVLLLLLLLLLLNGRWLVSGLLRELVGGLEALRIELLLLRLLSEVAVVHPRHEQQSAAVSKEAREIDVAGLAPGPLTLSNNPGLLGKRT